MVWFSLKFWKQLGKSEEGCGAELEKEGYDNVLDIFIAEYDKGKLMLDLLEKEIGWTGPIFSFFVKGGKVPSFRDTWKKIKMEGKCWLEKEG